MRNDTRMKSRSSLSTAAFLLLAATHSTGCGTPSTDPTVAEAGIRGIIVARAPILPDGEAAVWSGPIMLVDGTAFREAEEPCQAQWWFSISGKTTVWQGDVRADTSHLTIGREVEVWSSGEWLLPCPAIGAATRVQLR